MTSTVRAGKILVWKDAVLRASGFPADLLLRAAASTTVALIDANAPREALDAAFKEDTRQIGELLREVIGMPAFREAVLWQNRTAVHGSMGSLLKRPAGAVDSKTREYERLVASYLQRYCAKNDTIGFFGPVGWATLDSTTESKLTPATDLSVKRTVYFEHWAIDKLAEKMSQNLELRQSIAPILMPTVYLEGDVLHVPVAKTNQLTPAVARLVRACDGTRPARAIAEELAAVLESVQDVYDLLDELVDNKIVIWRLQVPTAGFYPERALRSELAKLEPNSARTEAEAMLTELERARDGVAAAAGTVDPLDAAMVTLDDLFVRLTGTNASRNAGKTYAGRRTFFEDCRRGGELVLGRSFLDKIAVPLELITTSARWFSSRIAAEYRTVFRDHYRALVDRTGAREIDFIQYYTELQPLLPSQQGTASPTVLRIRDELQARWTEILALPADAKRVQLRSEDLASAVREAFACDGPGWPMARHHSPDLMIAATDPDALARGDLVVVLGEIHTCLNTVTLPALAKEHVDPARLFAQRREETGRTIALVEPRSSVRRASSYSLSDGDLDVEVGDARSRRPRSDVYDVAGFVVVEHHDQLWVARRDGSFEVDIIAFLEGDLNAEAYDFELVASAAHRPRVSIDDFVIMRERWKFPTTMLGFASAPTPLERFIGARKWATHHGLPRFMFTKAASEPKPMYLDLESPVYVELLGKLARSDEFITLSEMYPSFDDLWLTDADGRRYTSELRMAFVDDEPWKGFQT